MLRKWNLLLLPLAACQVSPPAQSTGTVADGLAGSMLAPQLNDSGFAETRAVGDSIDESNPFFVSIGTNGRACVSCHQAAEGWTINPRGVQRRFLLSDGLDPLFRPHDGANAPNLDVSTVEARRQAYSLLLSKALIRIQRPLPPATAEFELVAVDDPYGFGSTSTPMSFYRRPLPTTNLGFLGGVNWDLRNSNAAAPSQLRQALLNQANGASVNHAQAVGPIDPLVLGAIVDFELGLSTAQSFTWNAGALDAEGAAGGPELLRTLPFTFGMNSGPSFVPQVFDLYTAWDDPSRCQQRRDVAEGERIFNQRPLGAPGRTCSGCHNTPEVGGNSGFKVFDIGTADEARRPSDLPLYTFRNKATGELRRLTDAGRGAVDFRWSSLGAFKAPGLRGLAARGGPYFHDGGAPGLLEVIEHYDQRFGAALTNREKRLLLLFLTSL